MSPSGFEVRAAQPDDDRVCSVLCSMAVEELGASRGGPLFSRRETGLVVQALVRPGGLRRLLDDPRRRIVVADSGSSLLGLGVSHVEELGDVLHGVIDGYYVAPAERGRGAGPAILHEMLSALSALGCVGVDAAALPGDRAAKSMLEEHGFKARVITMHRPLG